MTGKGVPRQVQRLLVQRRCANRVDGPGQRELDSASHIAERSLPRLAGKNSELEASRHGADLDDADAWPT